MKIVSNLAKYFAIGFSAILITVAYRIEAEDSGEQRLSNAVGSTDYFKVKCAAKEGVDTDRLSLKILDATQAPSGNTPSVYPQIINAKISKDGASKALTIVAGEAQEALLVGGNGKYKIIVDTAGTDQTRDKKNKLLIPLQKYTLEYGCLNSAGKATKKITIQNKTIKTNTQASLTVTCARNKVVTPADTDSLYLKINNVSPVITNSTLSSLPILNAQISRVDKGRTVNTTDLTGDLLYGPEIKLAGGNGDYFISVDHTGTHEGDANNAKMYSFQYHCVNASDIDTAVEHFELLQDQ